MARIVWSRKWSLVRPNRSPATARTSVWARGWRASVAQETSGTAFFSPTRVTWFGVEVAYLPQAAPALVTFFGVEVAISLTTGLASSIAPPFRPPQWMMEPRRGWPPPRGKNMPRYVPPPPPIPYRPWWRNVLNSAWRHRKDLWRRRIKTRTDTPPPANLRIPVSVVEGLTGGVPKLRFTIADLEALTGGDPNLRIGEVDVEALTGGVPKLRFAVSVVEVLVALPENPWAAMIVYPSLVGVSFSVKKNPGFKTRANEHVSGQETRTATYQYPKWEFDLSYDYLPSPPTQSDYATFVDFFLNCAGMANYFLFRDTGPLGNSTDTPDYQVRDGFLATADGVTLQFPFARRFAATTQTDSGTIAGFLEPVGQVDSSGNAAWTFPPSAVNTGASTITIPGHGFTTGLQPYFVANAGTFPAPLAANTPYWIIVVDANTIQLATTEQRALAGTAITLTSQGTGTNTVTKGFDVLYQIVENDTVPSTPGPYTITVANSSAYADDGGVVTAGGLVLAAVSGTPGAGQYSVNQATGVYTFNAAQQGVSVAITYKYQISSSLYTFLSPNQLVFGSAPASGIGIYADFDFWFVCRMLEDVMDMERFMYRLWNLKKVNFTSVPTNPAP